MSIRIVLVDDHSRVHHGIAAVVESFDDLELVGHGSNGQEALQLCAEFAPDIVLMDVYMPVMDGVTATRQIRERFPAVKVLALSSFQDEESVRAMLDAGAVGYLVKSSSIDDLAPIIRAAHTGKLVFSPEVSAVLLSRADPAPKPDADYGLTAREMEILQLMAQGKNNNEIADALTISLSTAKFHVSSVIAKLRVSNRVEAVALALEKRLVGG